MKSTLQRLKDHNREDGGFTLIELLVVIVIIGILAGVVVFAVSGITNRGDDSACKADKQTLTVAEEANFAQKGSYATESALVSNGFLQSQSTKYDITSLVPASSYAVTTTGAPCP